MAYEDDMVIQASHVQAYQRWNQYTSQQLQPHAAETVADDIQDQNDLWQQNVRKDQWKRVKPGFLRAEVLLEARRTQFNSSTPYLFSAATFPTAYVAESKKKRSTTPQRDTRTLRHPSTINTKHCCSNTLINGMTGDDLTGDDLMIWEVGILGMGVRALESIDSKNRTWVSWLNGPTTGPIPSYWTGRAADLPLSEKPDSKLAYHMAQSAGWMASSQEVMDYHTELCRTDFLPPFDPPRLFQDGLFGTNQEYWLGGMQLWYRDCNIQRFIPLDELDQFLLYHSSNNKKGTRPASHMTTASDLLRQLQIAQQAAEKELEA